VNRRSLRTGVEVEGLTGCPRVGSQCGQDTAVALEERGAVIVAWLARDRARSARSCSNQVRVGHVRAHVMEHGQAAAAGFDVDVEGRV